MSSKNVVNIMKNLGILIDNKPTWSAHTDYMAKKVNGTLHVLV